MFEGGSDKGLFTFYWEEYQNHKNEVATKERPCEQDARDNDLLYKFKREMEEKKRRQQKLSGSDLSSKVKFPLQGLFGGGGKENRAFELPNTIDLSSKLDEAVKQSCTQFKLNFSKSTTQPRKKSEGPLLHKKPSEDKKTVHLAVPSIETIEKLVLEEPTIQMNQFELKLDPNRQNESKFARSNRVKKSKKATTHIFRGKLTEPENIIPVIAESQQTTPRKLPALRATFLPPKKARRQKEGFTLEKMIMDRSDLQPSSSVVTLGMESPDQYRERWKQRKQQFLKLLSRNMGGELQ